MNASQRVWGYTGSSGMVQGFAAGYFLWDLMASIKDVDVHGWGALIHAASALAVTSLGFVSLCHCHGKIHVNVRELLISNNSDHSLITTESTSFSTSSQRPSSTSIGLWTKSA